MVQSYKKSDTFISIVEEIKDFETFYSVKLAPFFDELKARGQETSLWGVACLAAAMFAVCSFLLGQATAGIFCVLLVFITVFMYRRKRNAFITGFKSSVIKEIIGYLNPGMTYTPDICMSPQDYEKSGLFRKNYNEFTGDDHLQGIYKGVSFYCSELFTANNERYSSSRETPIFKGLFFAAPLNVRMQGNIYIWPAGREQLGGSLMDEYYRLMPLPDVYRMDMGNPAFEEFFSVYATHPQEVGFLADAELMADILAFQRQISREVRMSFVGDICYVSVAFSEDLFVPSFSHPENKEKIQEYFFSVLLVLSIINQLKLYRYV